MNSTLDNNNMKNSTSLGAQLLTVVGANHMGGGIAQRFEI